MNVAIVGCGDSAEKWGERKFDLSIGVNDAAKWGYPLDQLVLINFQRKFSPPRLRIILNHHYPKVWTHTATWQRSFPHATVIKLTEFNGNIRNDLVYCSKTSPIVACSLALKQGAKSMVIFGVDMLTHQAYRVGTKSGDYEIKRYTRFFEQLTKRGVKVFRGASGSAFDHLLPLYQNVV